MLNEVATPTTPRQPNAAVQSCVSPLLRQPEGTERLYSDGRFFSDPGYCESYGRDLITGAPLEPVEYQAMNPSGKAIIKAAAYLPPHEQAGDEHPLLLITGRTVYHFHTRTKTARVPQLQAAAPDIWVELSRADAKAAGITEGDLVRVSTPRGHVRAKARITGIRDGVIFLPFHYGYWDTEAGHEPGGEPRAANELTLTDWDPASKQPLFKTAAARIELHEPCDTPAPAPTHTASMPVTDGVPPTRGGPPAEASEIRQPVREGDQA
jgi:anaerobic selenocysteine-containing dehydrogenase